MLERLINGNEISRFLLIKDSLEQSGHNLLRAFLKFHSHRTDADVHLLCYEWSPEVIATEGFKLKIYDGVSDPLGWESEHSDQQIGYNLSAAFKNISDAKNPVVAIDSLTVVLLHHPVRHVYKALYDMLFHPSNAVNQVIAVVHSDVHDEETLNHLESLATSVLQVTSTDNNKHALCSVCHKSPGGKVVQETVQWKVNECYDLVVNSFPDTILPKLPTTQPIPLTNLTFNVSLKDDEKIAREQLVLPYTRNLTTDGDDRGIIYYQMDEVDDFDEDDPDDDLNI